MIDRPTNEAPTPTPLDVVKQLRSLGSTMRRRGMSVEQMTHALAAMNQTMSPPLDDRAFAHVVKHCSAVDPAQSDPHAPTWMRLLKRDGNGLIKRDRGNAALFLQHHEAFTPCLAWDTLADRLTWYQDAPPLPGAGLDTEPLARPRAGEAIADWHSTYVGHWLALVSGASFTDSAVIAALEQAARARPYQPVVQWLRSLTWDGEERVSRWLSTYLGATPHSGGDEYLPAVGTWWLVSAVARAMRPGCQADHMLVLEGPQAAGKSQAIEALTGGSWFLRGMKRVDSLDALQGLRGKWIVAMNELEALRRVDIAAVKEFLTMTVDEYRPSYGRFFVERPRQCVFIGTTNERQYLHDPTGGRRFWPVRVGHIDMAAITRDRDQLWAEATQLYDNEHRWWPTDELADSIWNEQDDRYDHDGWEDLIADWLKTKPPRARFSTDDLRHELNIEVGRWGRAEQTRVGHVVSRLGCTKHRENVADEWGVRRWFFLTPRHRE